MYSVLLPLILKNKTKSGPFSFCHLYKQTFIFNQSQCSSHLQWVYCTKINLTELCFYNVFWHLPMVVKNNTVKLSSLHFQQTSEPYNLQIFGSGFITQTEITHLSLPQQCPLHLNTIIHRVIYRLCASKLAYFSCGRQVWFPEQHLPTEKWPQLPLYSLSVTG